MRASLPETILRIGAGTGLALAVGALSYLPIAPAQAAQPDERLQNIERALGQARERRGVLERETIALDSEITKLRRRSVRVAARAQQFEAEITTLEQRGAELGADEAEKAASLRRRRVQIVRLLAALQRIARHPPAALIALPASPVETLRSAMLLRAAVPALERQAVALRSDINILADVRDRIAHTRSRVEKATVALDAERDRLEAMLEEKSRFAARTRLQSRRARERTARLADQARDLQDLLARLAEARLAEARRKPPPQLAMITPPAAVTRPGKSDSRGGAGLPVRGRIIRSFGQADGLGGMSKGITIEARKAARVVAPQGGEVVFAGPFRGFGQLLIIEHAKGYHTLLAGLARIDTEVGEKVLTGEPVGVLVASPQGKPALYVELRRRGRPVNPLPWLAAGQIRVNG